MNMTGFEVSRPGGVLLWRSQSHDWVCPKWRSHLLHDTRVQRLYLQQQPGGQVRSSYVKLCQTQEIQEWIVSTIL